MVKGVIFDLDGVVVDTAKYHYLAWRRLAAELGFDFSEQDNERLKGVSRMASLDILLEVGGLQERFSMAEKEQLAARKNGWYVEYISAMTPHEVLPGVVDFITGLREHGIGIALGSASKNTGIILERVNISTLFDKVVDGNVVSRAKPDPEVFLVAAQGLGRTARECVVFEDAEAGVEAAVRASMRCVGVGRVEVLGKANFCISTFEGFSVEQFLNNIDNYEK